jgi:DNA polymerase III epsilon subunit family exonuclease
MTHAYAPLTDVTFLAFDTETTGLFPIMHRVVEVGAVRFRLDGQQLATFQTLVDPQTPIPEDAQRIHRITDSMVRGQRGIEHVLPRFIEFLGAPDTVLLAHNAPFDLGFLAMALTRLGMPYPPHRLIDTLDLARRLYPTWPSHSLENMGPRLNVAGGAEHRALADAFLVKDVFTALLRRRPTVKSIVDLVQLSPLLTFADALIFPIEPPAGFEALSTALSGRCAVMIVYGRGRGRPKPRKITPRLLLEASGLAYVMAYCHEDRVERTFRLDRIQACWLE